MDNILNEEALREVNINIISHGKDKQGSDWRTNQAVELFSKLYYVVDGEMELIIDDKHYTLRRGSLALLPEGHIIYFKVKTGKSRFLQWVHFRASLNGESIFDFMRGEWVVQTENYNEIIDMFERFHQSNKNNLLIDCIEKKISLLRILDIFFNNSDMKIEQLPQRSSLDFEGIIRYIDKHAVEGSINLNILADRLHVHPNHLMREFKKKYGISPMKYVNNVRIMIAMNYLKNTKVPIKTIAETMGYDTTGYFCNFFKRNTGMSPTDYRNTHLK